MRASDLTVRVLMFETTTVAFNWATATAASVANVVRMETRMLRTESGDVGRIPRVVETVRVGRWCDGVVDGGPFL
jgi:hypothetical protein